MKYSNLSLEKLIGAHHRARHKVFGTSGRSRQVEEPIIHREIQGDRVYVPLNLSRVWNEV